MPAIATLSRALLKLILRLKGARWPAVLLGVLFFASWFAMSQVDPDNKLIEPGYYFWFFSVTIATVGYGDLYPATLGGRIVGAFVIFGGIALATLVITQLGLYVVGLKGKRMSGLGEVRETNHVVIVGYQASRTSKLVDYLLAEDAKRHIVICAPEEAVSSHPLPQQVHQVSFIKGDYYAADTYQRANITAATFAIVDIGDDNSAVFAAIAIRDLAPQLHTAASVQDLDGAAGKFRMVDGPMVETVPYASLTQLADVASTPGIGQYLSDLSAPGGSINSYVMPVPSRLLGHTVFDAMRELAGLGGAVLYLRHFDGSQTNGPRSGVSLKQGDTIGYMAAAAITVL